MPVVQLSDITLNVLDAGQGPTVLLVHGFPLDAQMWRFQVEDLARDFRVLVPDLRGFGHSSVTPGIVTMAQFADDLAALLDAQGVREPVHFCGLSMGGYIAWEFVRRHRERLHKLVLCDTRAAADSPAQAQGRLETAHKVLLEGPTSLVATMLPKLFAAATANARPDVVAATQQIMLGTSPAGIAAALRGMAERNDFTSHLATIAVPTLALCGEADIISPVAEMHAFAAQMPRAKFQVIPAAGHMAPLENPAAVNAAIRAFLSAG